MNEELLKAIRALLTVRQRVERAGATLPEPDQEAFVREETKGKFGLADVNKVLSSIDTSVGGRNLARSAIQGASFNFGDELLGLLPESMGGGEAGKQEMRLRDQLFAKEHPVVNAVAGAAGGLAVPGLGAGSLMRGSASLGAAALRGAASGAVAGGLAGAGSGEGAEDRLGRAGMGAAVGGAAGAVIPATVGAARYLYSPAARAARRFGQAVDASGGAGAVRTQNAALAAAGRGEQALPGDLSPQLHAVTDYAANNSDDVRSQLVPVLQQRQADAGERLLGDVKAQVGDPIADQRLQELASSRRTWAASDDGFEGLRKAGAELNVAEIEPVLAQPKVRDAWRAAQQTGLIGEFPDVSKASFQMLQDTKEALDDAASAAFRQGRGNLGQRLAEARDLVRQTVEKQLSKYPGVSAEYARRMALEDALQAGQKAFNAADSRGLADYVKTLKPDALAEYRLGMASELISSLSSKATNRSAATELTNASPALQRKLEIVFGGKAGFETFMKGPKAEAELAKLRATVAGSATHRRGSAADFDPAEAGIEAMASPAGAAGLLTRLGAKAGKGVMSRRTAGALGPYMTTQGTQNIEALLSAFRTDNPLVGPLAGAALPTSLGGLFGTQR